MLLQKISKFIITHGIVPLLTFLGPLFGYQKYELVRRLNKKALVSDDEVDILLETWNGIPVYIFKSKDISRLSGAGIVYFNGGGWTLYTVEHYSRLLCNMVKFTGAVVVSLNYRKAPEHPFPAAFDDCYYVTSTFMERAEEFGVDAKRIAVSGNSAGGNLAAAVSHKLCNEPSPPGKPALQYLINPAFQCTVYNLPSTQYNRNDAFLPTDLLNKFKINYLGYDGNKRVANAILNHGHLIANGELDQSLLKHLDVTNIPNSYLPRPTQTLDLQTCLKASEKLTSSEREHILSLITNPLLAPLCAKDDEMRNLPKTFVLTCSDDVLLDEGILYYERLKHLGASPNHHHLNNMIHTWLFLSKFAAGKTVVEAADEAVLEYFSALEDNL